MQATNQTCVLCEFVINVLGRYVNQNSTEPEIEKWLQYVCSVFPSSIKSECNSFVDQYGPLIISLLVRKIEPEKICQTIELCPRSSQFVYSIHKINSFDDSEHLYKHRSQHLDSEKTTMVVATTTPHDLPCTVCQFSMEYLYHEYNIEQTEKNLEYAIENVCSLTPSSYRSHCEDMVSTYGSKLVDLMRKYSNSLEVCKQIKLCKAEQPSKEVKRDTVFKTEQRHDDLINLMPPPVVKSKKVFFVSDKTNVNAKNGSLECQLCIYAAQLVEGKLKENKTDAQIVEELKLVCNLFPTNLKDQV